MQKLYTPAEMAERLKITRQALEIALKDGRIEEPSFITGRVKGWTLEQVERIEKTFVRRSW